MEDVRNKIIGHSKFAETVEAYKITSVLFAVKNENEDVFDLYSKYCDTYNKNIDLIAEELGCEHIEVIDLLREFTSKN